MPNPTERAIFLQAVEEENLSDRLAYLDAACGDDTDLRASVDALLAAHDAPAKLLDHPIGTDRSRLPSLPLLSDAGDLLGTQVGPYTLKEQIGQGGFGLVFVAEQEEPVQRKVALKIVKPGLGSREVIARFEAERQAVALMNHPNIAQIFDAGVAANGRPYFAMELVRGLPVVDFCNQLRLSIPQRLELMIDVCSAVHHAHQKGIIHRDLKPSNVMVTLHDGKPVAKVIDFGVAKALSGKLTDKTVYTSFLAMIGTPLYMSPEQAEMSGLDIDTRSDVFSLGVILYELLAGRTPFDRERLDSAGLDELRRIIREEEPPRPSVRLSTCGKILTTIADQRRVDPRGLATVMQGDLDWIVMKSLDKDRSRRYDSAAALAAEIRRYLDGKPIQARPPSTLYRIQKYARRHRVAFLTTMLVGITMVVGTAASLWQMSRAIDERNAKDAALRQATHAQSEAIAAKQKVEQFAEDLVRANELVVSGQAHADAGRWTNALQDFEAAVSMQPAYYLPRVQRAQLYTRIGLWPEAGSDYAIAMNKGASTAEPQWWGVPALFLYTADKAAFRDISEQRRAAVFQDADHPQWMLVRDLTVSGELAPTVDFGQLALMTERWLQTPELEGRPKPPEFDARPNRPPPNPGPRQPGMHSPANRFPGQPPHGPRRDRFGQAAPADIGPLCLRQYIAGLALLRASDLDAAIHMLKNAERDPHWPAKYLVHAPLALAHYRQGNIQLASQALERSDAGIKEWLSASQDRPQLSMQAPWFDLLEGLLINREAWQAIRGTSSPLASQLDQLRAASKNLINGSQP